MKKLLYSAIVGLMIITATVRGAQQLPCETIETPFEYISCIDVATIKGKPCAAVASSSNDKCYIFDLIGKYRKRLSGHTAGVIVNKFLTNSKTGISVLVTGAMDGEIKIWSPTTYTCERTIVNKNLDGVTSLAFWGDTIIVAGHSCGDISLWDINDGKMKGTLRGHTDSVRSLLYKNDNILISGSFDGTIMIWDLEKKECKYVLTNDDKQIWALCSLKNELISGSEDGSIRSWNLQNGKSLKIVTLAGPYVDGIIAIDDDTFVYAADMSLGSYRRKADNFQKYKAGQIPISIETLARLGDLVIAGGSLHNDSNLLYIIKLTSLFEVKEDT